MSTVKAPTQSERAIPLSEPCLRGNELVYLKECVESGWVSSAGTFVKRFERAMAECVGATHAVAVVNGTAGLHLALRVAGVQADDEVLVPTLTFIAPVNAIRYCGAHPVFVDADRVTWQMDVEQARAFLERGCEHRETRPGTRSCWNARTGRRVRAILPVHLLGLASPMAAIMDLARRFRLRVIEDAAEAIGRTVNVGSGRETGIEELVGLVARLLNRPIEIVLDDARVRPESSEVTRLVADATTARQLLGWTPSVTLEEGVQRTIAWMQEHRHVYRQGAYAV